eukprot:SAG31_NODE_332_length_17516_cov_3.552840_7_plen_165_part_00
MVQQHPALDHRKSKLRVSHSALSALLIGAACAQPQIEEVQRLRLAMATKHGIEVLTLLAADEDGDGKIEKNEIVDLMEHAGQTNVAEVKKEFCAADTNSDGALSTSDKDNEKLAKFSELATRKMLRLPLRNAPFVPQRPDVQLACKVRIACSRCRCAARSGMCS